MTTLSLWKGESKMKTYRVKVTRTVNQSAYIEVDAENRDAVQDEFDPWSVSDGEWDDDFHGQGEAEIDTIKLIARDEGDEEDDQDKKDLDEAEAEEESA